MRGDPAVQSECADDIHRGTVPSAAFADKGQLIGVFQTVAVLLVPAGGGHVCTVKDRAGTAVIADLMEMIITQILVFRRSAGSCWEVDTYSYSAVPGRIQLRRL